MQKLNNNNNAKANLLISRIFKTIKKQSIKRINYLKQMLYKAFIILENVNKAIKSNKNDYENKSKKKTNKKKLKNKNESVFK